MRVAIIGSRELEIEDFSPYLPAEITEIVSGGARGIDRCARRYAYRQGLKLKEFLPDYDQHGRSAPLIRNLVVAFWDGSSPGTRFVIENCKKKNKPIKIFKIKEGK